MALPKPGNSESFLLKRENDFNKINKGIPECSNHLKDQCQTTAPEIIPLPQSYKLLKGHIGEFFYLKANTAILLEKNVAKLINPQLRKQWQKLFEVNFERLLGVPLTLPFYVGRNPAKKPASPSIILKMKSAGKVGAKDANQNKITPGSYDLRITPNQVIITASDQSGFLYGLVSLLQLGVHDYIKYQATGNNKTALRVACWQIQDQPNFEWRGLMLDESRHFFGKAEVEKLLTWMAYYKLNRFHWHLTDEPAWRIQINAYPKLTEIGAIGNKTDSTAPAKYYTQADIKEVVHYAKALGITVIPEIDMPGHATAANRAYPENSGGGTGKFANFTFNPGRDSTYNFLTNILREVQGAFQAKMVHLGGDEVAFGNGSWSELPAVKKLMASQHLKDNKAVEAYFLKTMVDSALQFYNKVLTWDEGVDAALNPKNTIICWWRHDKLSALRRAIEKGYDVVMCPRIPLYFDFVQDSTHKVGRKWSGKYASLKQVFDFYPQAYTAKMNKSGRVLGIQANLWTETVHTVKRLDFMLFPRMAALASAAWADKSSRQFTHFEKVLKLELHLYKKADVYYYNPFSPDSTPEVKK